MITPIVLEQEPQEVQRKANLAKEFAKTLHIDIIDGMYADNLTIAPADLQGLDLAPLEIDLHLLVDDPTEWVEECVALKPARLIAQVERMGNVERYLDTVKQYQGVKAGIGIGVHTEIGELGKEVWEKADAVILMAIEAGYSGRPFLPAVLPRIRALRKLYSGTIIVDGGINPKNAKLSFAAGASEVGANSFMWKGDPKENYRKLKTAEEK